MQRSSSLSKLESGWEVGVAGSDQLDASQPRTAHPGGLLLSELSHDELAGLVLSSTMLWPSHYPSASPVTASTPSGHHEQQPPPMQTNSGAGPQPASSHAGPAPHRHYAALSTPFPSPDRPKLQRAAAASRACSPNHQDQADCFRQIANLEMALKTSIETQKALQEQMVAEIQTRKLCEQALETCRQEREREQAERESERERERAAMEQSTREVGEKAIKFVASEILRLNERFLQLETKLREVETQRDHAIAALVGHNATPQTRMQPCKGPADSSRQTSQQPPEPQPEHRLPSESGGECASVRRCVRCRTCSIRFKVIFARAESLLTPGTVHPMCRTELFNFERKRW